MANAIFLDKVSAVFDEADAVGDVQAIEFFFKIQAMCTRFRCDDQYVRSLAEAVTGKLGGKVGVAPRIFLKKLVADVLDRVDLHEGFNPRADYQLTIGDVELTTIERHAAAGTSVDEIELEL